LIGRSSGWGSGSLSRANPDENLDTALELIHLLGQAGCDLILLPELWPSGYNWATLRDDVRVSAEPLDGKRTARLAEAARSAGAWLVAGSVPEEAGDAIFNTALVFLREGELRAFHRKAHLYTPMKEHEAVAAGDTLTTLPTEEFGTLGVSVCFDGDFPEVARAMRLSGVRVVAHVCAYEVEAETWWDRLYPAHALENGQWWFMSNQCGRNPSGTLLGASQVISPFGDVIAQASRVHSSDHPRDPETLVVEVSLRSEIERAERENAVLWSLRRPEMY
jgi:predicted amidohydrolase